MYAYIARRLLATIPVMTVVALFVFLLLRLSAGDPAAIIAGDNATSEQVAQIRARLGLDQPIPRQFVIWLGQICSGDGCDRAIPTACSDRQRESTLRCEPNVWSAGMGLAGRSSFGEMMENAQFLS